MSKTVVFSGLGILFLVYFFLGIGHYRIPSESMQPTLEVGDHIYVSKIAYGLSRNSLPSDLRNLPIPDGKFFSRLPKRGDVAVFINPRSGITQIKRVIGLPGDEIAVMGGRYYLNGELIDRKILNERTYRVDHGGNNWGYRITVNEYEEQWPGEDQPHAIYEVSDKAVLDNAGEFVVPADTVFFIGDNRDRSLDSRASDGPGFVPVDHLIGRADRMMFSFKKCPDEAGLYCPKRSFMQGL